MIEFYGMEVASINYLMYVGNLGSQIIGLSMEYFGQRLNRAMTNWGKAPVILVPELRQRSFFLTHMGIPNWTFFEGWWYWYVFLPFDLSLVCMCIDKHPNVITQTHFSVNQVVRLQDASCSPLFNSFYLAFAFEHMLLRFIFCPLIECFSWAIIRL